MARSLKEFMDDAQRVEAEMHHERTKRRETVTPPSPDRDKWQGIVAKRKPSRADHGTVQASLKPEKWRLYDPAPLRRLIEQNPKRGNKDLLADYVRETGITPSDSWLKKTSREIKAEMAG
jgi:hypothetical protein